MEEIKKEIELLEKAISLLHKCKNWTAEDDDESYYMQERLNNLRLKIQEHAAAEESLPDWEMAGYNGDPTKVKWNYDE